MGQRLIIIAKFCDCLEPYEAWADQQYDANKNNQRGQFGKSYNKDTSENHNKESENQQKSNYQNNETKTQNSLQTLFLKQLQQKKLKQFYLLDDKQLQLNQQNYTEQNIFNPNLRHKIQSNIEEISIQESYSERSKKSDGFSIVQLDKLPQIVDINKQTEQKTGSTNKKHILRIRQPIDHQKEIYFLDQDDQNQYQQQYHNI